MRLSWFLFVFVLVSGFWFLYLIHVLISCPVFCFSMSWHPPSASSLVSPHLFLVMSVVSVYLVSVFPSLPVQSLFVFCSWLFILLFTLLLCSCFLFGRFWIFLHFFHVWFELWLWFELCIFALLLCLVLGCYFVFRPHLSAFGSAFCSPDPCLPV